MRRSSDRHRRTKARLQAEIRHTRDRLSDTWERLEERLSPMVAIGNAVARVKSGVRKLLRGNKRRKSASRRSRSKRASGGSVQREVSVSVRKSARRKRTSRSRSS
jgi:hypothetical protein